MNNFLAITYAFMLAYCPYDNVSVNDKWETYNNPTHVQFELGVKLLDKVELFAGEETLQVKGEDITNWIPYTQSYWAGARYVKEFNDKLILDTGIKHFCQHPVKSWKKTCGTFNASRTDFYVKVSGKVDIF